MERAAGGEIERTWGLARKRIVLKTIVWIELWHGAQEGHRIGVTRGTEDALGGAFLDEAAEIHYGDTVAEPTDERQVMRNEDQSEVAPLLHLDEQVDYLALDRDIEGGDTLVGNDETRLDRKRPRDSDPLTLPPR
jgi:hypothetical protein